MENQDAEPKGEQLPLNKPKLITDPAITAETDDLNNEEQPSDIPDPDHMLEEVDDTDDDD